MPTIMLVNDDGTQVALKGVSGALVLAALAGEENTTSLLNGYIHMRTKWNVTAYNPRAASIGSAKGAAGAVGNAEVLIGSGSPVFLGKVITEDDTVAGSILLRDTNQTGQSVSARALASVLNTVSQYDINGMYNTGLTICGTAAGVSAFVMWRPQV